jgi:starch phosphorylase
LASRADNKDTVDLESVLVELYADGVNGIAPERVEMKCRRQLLGATNGYVFKAAVPATRPRQTVRHA